MKAKVTIYTHKTLADGKHPVVVILRKQSKRKVYSLGINIHPSEWDDKAGWLKKVMPVKVDDPGYETYKNYRSNLEFILKKQHDYDRMIEELIRLGKPFNFDTVIARVENPPEMEITVQKLFEKRIQDYKHDDNPGQARLYGDTLRRINDFSDNRQLMFYQLDFDWHMNFKRYLTLRGNKKGTLHRHLRTIRAVYNMAIRMGIARQQDYPYKLHPEIMQGLKSSFNSKALTRAEIQQIRDLDLEEGSDIWHARNYFMFMYLGHGHGIGDLARFKWDDIEGGRLYYVRFKTRRKVNQRDSFLLTAEHLKILSWYRVHWKKLRQLHNPYIFPILNGFHRTEEQKMNRILKVSKQINAELKVIGEKIHATIKVTTYTARHSMANNLVDAGVDIVKIKQILRHQSIETTQHYIKQFDKKDIDEAVGLL